MGFLIETRAVELRALRLDNALLNTFTYSAWLRRLLRGWALPFRTHIIYRSGLRPLEGIAPKASKAETEGRSPSSPQAAKPIELRYRKALL